jgi:hypothetical protein
MEMSQLPGAGRLDLEQPAVELIPVFVEMV